MKFPVIFFCGLFCLAFGNSKIDPQVLKELKDQPTLTVFISFQKSNTNEIRANFATIKHTLSTRADKLKTLYQMLKEHSDGTQHNVRLFLEAQNPDKSLKVTQSWMTNELVVKGIDRQIIETLAEMNDVKEIRADKIHIWIDPIIEVNSQPQDMTKDFNQWGVNAIQAPKAWAMGYLGQGVVVGSIDTGVRGSHEALRHNFREENGWFDPIKGSVIPTDNEGHGTHTMGTIVGQTNGIGVAPQAKWISCKSCSKRRCQLSDLIICGNFMGCPTDVTGKQSKCELAPNLVSNSWSGGQGEHYYDDIISTWILADIAPLFSAGNLGGEGCQTARSPGDSIDSISVGSTNSSNQVSEFSSLGPTKPDKRMKPNVAAPGSEVFSSYNNDDSSYTTMSGTSMACPHAAGVVALLYSKNLNLSYQQIKSALAWGAQPTEAIGDTCGGIPDHVYPNNHVGAGRVDALISLYYVAERYI